MEEYTDIDAYRSFAMQDLLHFTRYMFKAVQKRKFVVGRHHEAISAAFQRVFEGKTTRLIINIGPRYGKTEMAVKNFIAMGLAMNAAAKFIHLSYSADLAEDNSQGVMDIVNCEEYRRLFPEVVPTSTKKKKWTTSAGGGVYAVSSSGQVTGFGAGQVDEEKDADEIAAEVEALDTINGPTFGGAIIIDDPIKPDDARSHTAREKVNTKFETTIRNRVNSRNTPIIIIMQRLDMHDLCGYLLDLEPEKWEVLKLPAIIDNDGRPESLWPHKFTLEELLDMKQKTPFVFATQYMQNPIPLEGLMYEEGFKTYSIIPHSRQRKIRAYIDTADTGKDYLCSIIYVETEAYNYVLDIYYTQAPMETTEPETASRLDRFGVEEAIIESNNGGRGFARNVDAQLRIMGNQRTKVKWFAQTANKASRIYNNSASVQNVVIYPEGWDKKWPAYHLAMTSYMKTGTNEHDDAPDCTTGTVEMRPKQRTKSAANFF